VSGTPPQDVLCSTWAAQVAGDASAPIFQPTDQFGRTIPGTDLPFDGGSVPRQVEAYHWGEMTSGGWSKAIWALLAPFALVNVAHWMLPAGARKGAMHDLIGTIEALLRLAGLLLTALFMTQIAVLVMDVVVGQCPAEPGKCLSSAHLGWLWAHQRLLSIAGALVLVAVLGVINHISVIKWALPGKAKARRGDGEVLAEDDSFYDGDADAPMLRATHLTAGLSVVVVLILGGTHRPSGWWLPVWVVAEVLLVAAAAAVLFFLRHPRDAMPDRSVPKSAARVGPALALALLAVTAAWGPTASAAQAKRDSTHMPLPLPGSDDVVGLAMIALDCVVALIVAALVPVVVSKWGSRRDTPGAFRPFALGGFAAPVTIIGGLLGAGLGAGYTYIAASCLGGKCSAVFSHSYGANSPLQLPASYESLSELWAVSGIVVVAGAVVLVLAFLTGAARAAKNILVPSYLRPAGIVQGSPSGTGQPFKVALSWQLARWRVLSARILTAMSAVIAIAALLCLEAQWASTKTPLLRPLRFLLDRGFLARPASALGLTAHRPFLAAVGAYVVTVITLAFLLRVYNAARRPDSARALGILWDLASYWPRAAHPFVPPCYAQRAVPDLVERAHRYIEEGHTVVLSAHSQGSLITLAAAMRMKACYPGSCKYLGLVMAGSQLQWAYPRAFPAVVNLHAYQRVLGDLNGRWYVLVRGTDPLGGPVLSWTLNENDGKLTACELTKDGTPGEEGPQTVDPHGPGLWIADHDWWISDPMPAAPADRGFALPPFSTSTQRHSGYWSHPQWDRAVARAAGLKPADVYLPGSSSGDVPHGRPLHSGTGSRALPPGTPEVRPGPADETASRTRFWAGLRSRISARVRTLTHASMGTRDTR
jgi:hypothetical protein